MKAALSLCEESGVRVVCPVTEGQWGWYFYHEGNKEDEDS